MGGGARMRGLRGELPVAATMACGGGELGAWPRRPWLSAGRQGEHRVACASDAGATWAQAGGWRAAVRDARGVQSRRPASAQRRWRGGELEKIRERATRPREEDKDARTESEDRRRGDAWSCRRAVGRGMGSTGENRE